MSMEDRPVGDDVAELNREAQKAVDRVIAARVELAAAIDNINSVRQQIADGSAAATAFIDNYMSPSLPNPPPVAPEVAAPPPAVEPPVFTTVDDTTIAIDNSSGGTAPVIADEFEVVTPPEPGESDDD